MALPLLADDSTIRVTGERQSVGYVNLTLQVLREFGIEIITERMGRGKFGVSDPGEIRNIEAREPARWKEIGPMRPSGSPPVCWGRRRFR